MICPTCLSNAEPAATVAGICVCADCGASSTVEGRIATAADVEPLSIAELQVLRKARGRVLKATR